MRILVIDNYDSFVYNLVQYLGQLGVDCDVRRNDEIELAEVGRLAPAGVLLSPGPSTPERAGICVRLTRSLLTTPPLLPAQQPARRDRSGPGPPGARPAR